MNFSGKVAIVTGGAQGIGKAISTTLLRLGMKLLICDINESTAKSFLEELPDDLKPNVIYKKCDVSSFEEFKAAFEKAKSTYGRIDVVINNAGMVNERQWKRMIEVNFIGVIHGIHLAFEYMGKNNGGSGGFVVNTASDAVAEHAVVYPGQRRGGEEATCSGLSALDLAPIYCATKHAVVGLTRSFGTPYHFGKTGVIVNAVCPGPTDTAMYHTFPGQSRDEKEGKNLISSRTTVTPDEIAGAVKKLLEDGINGALLSVDSDQGIRYEDQKFMYA